MKRIIVPTDFSDNAYNALHYVARLFPEEACEITLLHSYEKEFNTRATRIDIGKSEEVYQKLKKRFSKSFEALVNKIKRDTKGYKHTFLTHDTSLPIAKALNRKVKKEAIDLIALGTKGASGLREVLIGSQAVSIIKRITTCPILLIPEQNEFVIPKKICFASEFSRSLKKEELKLLKELTAYPGVQVQIAHVYNQETIDVVVESNYKAFKNDMGDLSYSTHWIAAKKKKKSEALQDFINEQKVDLLVMLFNKRNWFEQLFREPVIKNIGFHTKRPFLVIPSVD